MSLGECFLRVDGWYCLHLQGEEFLSYLSWTALLMVPAGEHPRSLEHYLGWFSLYRELTVAGCTKEEWRFESLQIQDIYFLCAIFIVSNA
jgi:hypothetical protein